MMYEAAKKLIEPALLLFGGDDGGVGYVNLARFLADLYAKDDEASTKLLTIAAQFNKLCQLALDKKL